MFQCQFAYCQVTKTLNNLMTEHINLLISCDLWIDDIFLTLHLLYRSLGWLEGPRRSLL
jgi:hypothetical protein